MATTPNRMQNLLQSALKPAAPTLCALPNELKDMIFREAFSVTDSLRPLNFGTNRSALAEVNLQLESDCKEYLSDIKYLVFDSLEEFVQYAHEMDPKQAALAPHNSQIKSVTLRLLDDDEQPLKQDQARTLLENLTAGLQRFPNLRTLQFRNEAGWKRPDRWLWVENLSRYDIPLSIEDVHVYEPHVEAYLEDEERRGGRENWEEQRVFGEVMCHMIAIQAVNQSLKERRMKCDRAL